MSTKIVLIGAGEVGYNLAKILSNDNFDLTIVDIDSEKCQRIVNSIDAHVICGNGASQRILQQIDMSQVDYLLALSRIDEVNLVVAKSAYEMGAKKIICRLRNTEYSHRNATITAEQFGIDHVVYPERAAQKEIENLIREPSAIDLQEFKGGEVKMVGLCLDPSSPLIGRTSLSIEESNPYIRHKLVLIIREGESIIPTNEAVYQKDDIAYFVGKSESIPDIKRMAGKRAFKVKNIMILGAGKIGRLLAKSLESDYDVRLVENDHIKAKKVGKSLSDTLILDADGLDIDFLTSENIQETDCFIAATENEKTNILASLLVKHYGAKQVILHITTTNYIRAIRRIGVDAVVSKNIAAVNDILNIIRSDQEEIPISRIEDIDVDALELHIKEDCKYLSKNMTLDKLPEYVALGAISRDGDTIVPNHHTDLRRGDQLLLFTKDENVTKVENLFL